MSTAPVFTAPVAELRRLAARVEKVIERRNTIPILGHAKIEAFEDGRLALTGTDLDREARAFAPPGTARVERPGATCVPGKLFADCLRKLSDGEATFTGAETTVALAVGRARYKLHCLPPQDFPEIKADEATASFELTPDQLTGIEASTGWAISTEETRYYLNGIYFEPEAGEAGHTLSTVATDGHRLSKSSTGIPVDSFAPIIVPRTAVALFKLVADAADDGEAITVAVNDRTISFETRAMVLVSKLIDGTFPDYRRVIPTEVSNPVRITLPRERITGALDRVMTIASERGHAMKFTADAGGLTLGVVAAEAGDATETIEATPAGEITIGFNGRYLAEALASLPGDTVRFALRDPGSPALLFDDGDPSRTIVLMPMRVS